MKDYKLSEIKKICEEHSTDYDRLCGKCPLRNGICKEIENAPATWEIDGKEDKETVVLTRKEYESLRQSLAQTTNRECELADRARALLHECDVLKIDLEKVRKETAKEILNRINEYNLDYNWDLKEEFMKLCKDYDVEVKE